MTFGRTSFCPVFIEALAGHYIVVDRAHPIAVSIDRRGRVVDVCSWASLIGPPQRSGQDDRSIVLVDDAMMAVHDVPLVEAALVHVDQQGTLRCTARRREDIDGRWRTAPIWREEAWRDKTAGGRWTFATDMISTLRWEARVRLDPLGEEAHWNGHSILASAGIDTGNAAACFQQADRRPWSFDPPTHVRLFDASSTGIRGVSVDLPELSGAHRWRSPVFDSDIDAVSAIKDYLTYTLTTMSDVDDILGVQPAMTVTGRGRYAAIDVDFGLDRFPHILFRRRDHPFDDLGNVGSNLRDRGVRMDEELSTALLDRRVEIARAHADISGPVFF